MRIFLKCFFITLYLIFVLVVLAEIIKRTSASDGRVCSTGIGCVGVSVIVAVMAFVVILDCGQRQKIDGKKKRKRHIHNISHNNENIRGRSKMTTKV